MNSTRNCWINNPWRNFSGDFWRNVRGKCLTNSSRNYWSSFKRNFWKTSSGNLWDIYTETPGDIHAFRIPQLFSKFIILLNLCNQHIKRSKLNKNFDSFFLIKEHFCFKKIKMVSVTWHHRKNSEFWLCIKKGSNFWKHFSKKIVLEDKLFLFWSENIENRQHIHGNIVPLCSKIMIYKFVECVMWKILF